MTAPDKIWVEEPEIFDGMGFWQETKSADLVQYTRADIADAAHRAGYELARAQAAELGAHIVAYDVAMKGNAR